MQKPAADFPKRQHFVPEMLQKRFAGRDGHLWYFDPRRPEGIDQTKPGNLFVVGHLYTLENVDGERFGTIEKLLSKVETATDPILDRVVERARSGLAPALTEEQRWMLLMFLFLQYRRTPDFQNSVPIEKSISEQLADIVSELEADGKHISEETRNAYLSPKLSQRLDKNFRAAGVFGDFPNSKSFLAFNARGLSAATTGRQDVSFILGSFPFFRSSDQGSSDLSKPGVELWLPIAPDVAIGLGGPQSYSAILNVGTGRTVYEMNRYIRSKSTVIASPSRYLVETLSKMQGPAT